MMTRKQRVRTHTGGVMKRRQFLKATGAASATLGSVGLVFFGYEAGRDPESYTGWELQEGAHQTFNRKKYG